MRVIVRQVLVVAESCCLLTLATNFSHLLPIRLDDDLIRVGVLHQVLFVVVAMLRFMIDALLGSGDSLAHMIVHCCADLHTLLRVLICSDDAHLRRRIVVFNGCHSGSI